ncbi:hypothetical protein ACIA47_23585 [Micromonospora sp. NPDC051227]|uniref:hypothetical protein n=1 Tax=Micromonospora sp. NPDC051227 TaxID=3364285 RepID=UPI0037955A94
MRRDLPLWPMDAPAWRLLHSHYVDAVAARRLGGLPRDLEGFLTAVMAGEVGVVATVTADGLAYVVMRRTGGDVATVPVTTRPMDSTGPAGGAFVPVVGGGRQVPLCRVRAKELGLSRRLVESETARVELMRATDNVPDDLSGLSGSAL